MKKFLNFTFIPLVLLSLAFFGCQSESDQEVTPTVTKITVSAGTLSSATATTAVTATVTGNDTATVSWAITSGSSYASLSASSSVASAGKATVNLTGKNTTTTDQTVTIVASVGSVSSQAVSVVVPAVVVNPTTPTEEVIKASDTPTGYASVDWTSTAGASSSKVVTVSTRADLVNYAGQGGYLIYVNGMIDMSEGMLPSVGGGSNEKLDAFVKTTTTSLNSSDSTTYPVVYETYEAYKNAYAAACSKTTEDGDRNSSATTVSATMWGLNAAYGKIIKLTIKSNTTIIGLTSSSGIKGGTISINGVSNVAIRNLDISDAYDPFPHHEENDGYNAQHDGITIQGSTSNIWIDRCTFSDTLALSYVMSGGTLQEKWQTYDGTCDIKNTGKYITVSNCKFYNHDKTMLIGSSDSDGDNTVRQVTLHNNYFLNCGQRLPMVRNTTIHIYNNYYDMNSDKYYSSQYAVGVRQNCIVYAENNYFGSGIKYSFKDSYGKLYLSGNTDNSSSGYNSTVTGSTLFSAAVGAYSYTPVSAEEAKTYATTKAGSGVLSVER